MLFRSAASIALVACVSHVAAQAEPYKLVKGPVLGLSFARRDTNGYQPEQSVCGDGDTCAEACGTGYETCASNDSSTHCYNPADAQICCSDGSGNSCDDGYYCSHDTAANTWCCPDSMNLVECAAAYNVDGALVSDAPVTSSAEPTTTSTTSVEPTTTSTEPETTSTEAETTTTPESTSTPVSTTSTTSTTSKKASTKSVVTKTEVDDETTTICPTPSAGYSTAWTGSNSTVTSVAPTQPYETPAASGSSSAEVPAVTTSVNGAAATGASALLIVAAGFFALL